MNKTIKHSLIFVFVLIVACTVVVVLNPLQLKNDSSASSGTLSMDSSVFSVADLDDSLEVNSSIDSLLNDSSSSTDSSNDMQNNIVQQNSVVNSELISDLIPEDQPDAPNLNYETSGSSYDDIAVNVLTCLLTQDMEQLSTYVGTAGLQLSPTGSSTSFDITLSADKVCNFFSLPVQCYGTYPGSGENIDLSPTQYYEKYIVPQKFDFSLAVVSYNDADDLSVVSSSLHSPKTISYHYAPNAMEWKHLILVFEGETYGDSLCGIIYQDVTTN